MRQEDIDELTQAEISTGLARKFAKLVEDFPSVTRFLAELSDWLEANDDLRGAALVADFGENFAAHEIKLL
jgi:hypothetical protein